MYRRFFSKHKDQTTLKTSKINEIDIEQLNIYDIEGYINCLNVNLQIKYCNDFICKFYQMQSFAIDHTMK